MKNILLATDITSNSDKALARSIRIANETNAALYILHVVPTYAAGKLEKLSKFVKEELQDLIHKKVETHHHGKNIKVYVNVVEASCIFEEILTQSHSLKADLVVLGMHNKKKLRDFFIGTTMERVIRASLKPVLVVKNAPSGSYKKVVGGVDYSPGSKTAFRMATEIASRANFYAIHAYDIPYYAEKTYNYAISRSLIEEKHQKNLDQFLKEETSYFKSVRAHKDIKISGQLLAGKPYKVLSKKVRSLKADLFAIGAHSKPGLMVPGTKLGGTALEILFDPPCDVVVANNWKEISQILI